MENDERLMVEKARTGDMSAFQQIFEKYKGQIYRVSCEFTGNHHDAEDILQEVLWKTYRSLDKFRGDARLSSWLHRITINTCIDRERQRRVSMTSSEELPGYALQVVELSPLGNPERQAEAEQIRMHIAKAVAELTPLERSVFILRQYQQLSIKEVAQILDRSEGTIKNMLWRALAKLQKQLAVYRKELGLEGSQ